MGADEGPVTLAGEEEPEEEVEEELAKGERPEVGLGAELAEGSVRLVPPPSGKGG